MDKVIDAMVNAGWTYHQMFRLGDLVFLLVIALDIAILAHAVRKSQKSGEQSDEEE